VKSLVRSLAGCDLPLVPPWFDTMLASYVLNPARRGHALEALAREYLDRAIAAREQLFERKDRERDLRRLGVPALARYMGDRVTVIWKLAERLRELLETDLLAAVYDDIEIPLVSVLIDMEAAGVRVDGALLARLSSEFESNADALAGRIYELAGEPFNIHSTRQLGEVLFERLGLAHGRRTKTGWSTDSDVLEKLSAEHELPRAVLEFRQLAKLRSTYTEALPKLVRPSTGRLHTTFNQAVASTGRLSSSDPNLQNIPTRSEIGRRIREAFVPRDETARLLSADYSQIELRIMAHLSQDRALRRAFLDGGDVHTLTAARIADCDPDSVRPEQRAAAKTVNFGVIYGMGPRGLAQQLGIPLDEARRFIEEYFASYPGVRHYTQEMIERARTQGYVTTLFGRKLALPDLKSSHPAQRSAAERVAVNAPIQGSAADIIKNAMVRVHRRIGNEGLRGRMILQVHDELVFDAPLAEVAPLTELVRHEMEHAAQLTVPIVVDVGVGRNWAEAH
jgi:DNA polymerase-1